MHRRQSITRAAFALHNFQQKFSYATTRVEQKQKSYYDILGITPKATQAQVKDAYYKMSKTYHPDQYKGTGAEDPSLKFREITEAYEVLGDYHKRKMYDKGILNISTAATPAEAEAYASRFYESRRTRGQAPTATGRTPIYNFDEWSKLHYESARERRANAKERYENLQRDRTVLAEQKKTESVVGGLVLLMMFIMFRIALTPESDSGISKKN